MPDFRINRRRFLQGAAASATLPIWLPNAAMAQEGDRLRLRLIEEVLVLDPAFRTAESELWVSDQVLPKLIAFKAGSTWEWELHSAESIEQVDPLTIAFKLKPGLMWSGDFGEVTAEDVKYSFERFIDPKLAAPNAPLWAPLDHVEVTDKYSGLIKLKEPYAGLFGYVLPYDGGQIVCKKAVEAAGGRFGSDVNATSGPYKVVQIQQGAGVILEKDGSWTGPVPAFQTIELVPITDSKAAENAIQSGDLDWGFISISSVPLMKDNVPAGLKMEILPTNNYAWLCSNMTNPSLQNESIRKAIQMSVDRTAIIEGAYFGVVEPSYGLATKGRPGYIDKPMVEYNLDAARALIEEAGVTGLALELEVPAETDKISAAQIVQANLAAIGLQVNINQHEQGAFWSLPSVKGKDIQLFLCEIIAVPPDVTWGMQWLLPEQAGIWNWQYFTDEEFRRLFYEASKELDPVRQDAILRQAQERLDLSYTTTVIAHTPRVVLYNETKLVPAMTPNGAYRLEQYKRA